MEPCTSTSKTFTRKAARPRALAAAALAAVLLWDTSALAINAVVSQDLPVLIEIAATELATYTELGAVLAETAAVVEQVTEYTNIAKTAWGAVEELRNMTLDDLRLAALLGVDRAFPELAGIYGNVNMISDLDYRDALAVDTLRGVLWEHAYGPGIDYLHAEHENFLAIANSREHRARNEAKLHARRLEAQQWEDDCRRTGGDGQGACQAAANRAEIINAILLTDIHQTALAELELHERQLLNEDRKSLDRLYEYERFFYDARNYMGATVSSPNTCPAGRCLYERYGEHVARRIAGYRARHRRNYPGRLPLSFAGEFGDQ